MFSLGPVPGATDHEGVNAAKFILSNRSPSRKVILAKSTVKLSKFATASWPRFPHRSSVSVPVPEIKIGTFFRVTRLIADSELDLRLDVDLSLNQPTCAKALAFIPLRRLGPGAKQVVATN